MKFRIGFIFSFFILLLGFYQITFSQAKINYRIGFYNVENFYDVFVDSTREYNAFTPEGDQHWDYNRFQLKRNNLYKTIMALGEGEPPSLLGLSEIENEIVLRELIYKTPLKKFNYQYVNYPSPDRRGIDVALIYRTNHFKLLSSKPIPVFDSTDPTFITRDILYASFIINDIDTLHFFINHWPSRYGGTLSSVNKRMLAAKTLKRNSDSINSLFPNAKIIIMGDFNDCPEDASLMQGLNICSQKSICKPDDLINLFETKTGLGSEGSLKYEQQWQIFDQIIVTKILLDTDNRVKYKRLSANIFTAPFLLVDDERYLGKKLFRTFLGPAYLGGFSDHLPVYLDLEWKENDSVAN